MTKEAKEEQTKLYVEYQMMTQELKEIQQRMVELNNQLNELAMVSQSIDELEKVEPGSQILSSIAPGIFVKSEIKDNKNFIVNVGGKTAVAKSTADTKQLLMDQQVEIQNAEQELLAYWQQLVIKFQAIQQKLRQNV